MTCHVFDLLAWPDDLLDGICISLTGYAYPSQLYDLYQEWAIRDHLGPYVRIFFLLYAM